MKEVYAWMLGKLFQMGALSKREMTLEADILNPLAMTMGATLSNAVK